MSIMGKFVKDASDRILLSMVHVLRIVQQLMSSSFEKNNLNFILSLIHISSAKNPEYAQKEVSLKWQLVRLHALIFKGYVGKGVTLVNFIIISHLVFVESQK